MNDIKRLFTEFTFQHLKRTPTQLPSLSFIGAEIKRQRDEERELMKIHHQEPNLNLPPSERGVSARAYFAAGLQMKRAQRWREAAQKAVS